MVALPTGRPTATRAASDMSGRPRGEWVMPSIAMLTEPKKSVGAKISQDALEQNARLLEGVLDDFGVKGEIVNVVGPGLQDLASPADADAALGDALARLGPADAAAEVAAALGLNRRDLYRRALSLKGKR